MGTRGASAVYGPSILLFDHNGAVQACGAPNDGGRA
jgi:hypothetical protein